MNPANTLYLTITGMLKTLFEREFRDLSRREAALVSQHTQLGGSPDGFRYLGLIYSALEGVARSRGSYDRLHTSLVPELDSLIADRKLVEMEQERVRQALTLTLRDCKSPQDMRDALPNSVKDLIPEIARLERTRPEAFTLAENERSYNQYMKLREKIDFYVASRLLY